jgi:hypothetical protein
VNGSQALCANGHPKAALSSIEVYLSTAYNQQTMTFQSVGPVSCQDGGDCHSGPALFALGRTQGQLLPFIDLAQQPNTPNQNLAIQLTTDAGLASTSSTSTPSSLPIPSIATPNSSDASTFQVQAEKFLTPSEISPTNTLEAGTPLINTNGQLTSLHLADASGKQTSPDIQTFISKTIPSFQSHSANTVHDGWQHGMDAYNNKDFAKAHTQFQLAADANPHFQAAKSFAVSSLNLENGNRSDQSNSSNTITIAGVSIPLWQLVIAIVLLFAVVLLVITLLLGRSRQRSLELDLEEAARRATIDAPQIAEMKAARNHNRAKHTSAVKDAKSAKMQQSFYEQPVQQKPSLIPIQGPVAQFPCPRCGELLSREAKYCPNCRLQLSPSGSRIYPPIAPEMAMRSLIAPLPVSEPPMGSSPSISFVASEQAKPLELETPPNKNNLQVEPPSKKSGAGEQRPSSPVVKLSQPINRRLGNYRLIRLLGKGGFADVYLGEHVLLGMQAAIKVLQLHLTKEAIKDFLVEARIIARLVHPHIVRILEFDVEGEEPDLEQSILNIEEGTPFLVMDYASGGTLRQRHPKGTRLSLDTVISYTKQVAEALEYAHQNKLIHRDIKPENMLIGSRDEILLSDFGIAVIAHSEHSMTTQQMAGTIPYMAPEQIRGKPQPASDQYSLGIVAYEWLSGTRPFQGSSPWDIMNQHLSSLPPSLRENNATISKEVEHVVLKALSKDPQQRFASVADFARALASAHE